MGLNKISQVRGPSREINIYTTKNRMSPATSASLGMQAESSKWRFPGKVD